MKEQLEAAAKQAGRSINAEVLYRLTETFEQVYINEDTEVRLDALEDRVWDILYTLGDNLKPRPDKQGR